MLRKTPPFLLCALFAAATLVGIMNGQVPFAHMISAITGEGLSLLKEAIAKRLAKRTVHRFMHLEPSQGRQRAKLFELGAVINERTLDDGGWSMELKMSEKDLRRFLKTENLAEEQLEPAALEPSVPAANE